MIFLRLKKQPATLESHSGIAIIEFAIALPVLLILLALLFECGRLYSVYLRFTEINWEGTRFFSSLKDPPEACISPATTNLSYVDSSYVESLSESNKLVYEFHRTVQDRVLSMFLYKPDSWPLESDGLVPNATGVGMTKVSDNPLFQNMPSISTQYVKNSSATPCTPPTGGNLSADDMNNTVTVCLSATYKGFFFDVPLQTCSSSYLLENNESLRIPELPRDTRTDTRFSTR